MPSALLIIDVQHGLCNGDLAAFDIGAVIDRINALSSLARSADVPVVVVQHEEEGDLLEFDSDAWQLDARVVAADADLHVRKAVGNAFHATPLHALLEARGIDGVVVCGLQSDQCIDATARGAAQLGYSVIVVGDAHSTIDQGGMPAADVSRAVNVGLAALDGSAVSVRVVEAARLHVDRSDFRETERDAGEAR